MNIPINIGNIYIINCKYGQINWFRLMWVRACVCVCALVYIVWSRSMTPASSHQMENKLYSHRLSSIKCHAPNQILSVSAYKYTHPFNRTGQSVSALFNRSEIDKRIVWLSATPSLYQRDSYVCIYFICIIFPSIRHITSALTHKRIQFQHTMWTRKHANISSIESEKNYWTIRGFLTWNCIVLYLNGCWHVFSITIICGCYRSVKIFLMKADDTVKCPKMSQFIPEPNWK